MNPDEEPPTQEPPAGPYVEPEPELARIWEKLMNQVDLTPAQHRLLAENFWYLV